MIPCSVYCGSAQLQRRADTVSELLNPLESWFWPNLSTQSEVSLLPLRQICLSQRKGCVREMRHRNWTWNAISLLATEVQVDWGLSLQILISCLGIGEHGLSSLLEMMLSPSFWQLKYVHLAPLLCSIMVIYEEGQGFNKSHRAIYILSVPSLLYSIMKCSSSKAPRGKHSFLLWSLAWKKHCRWFKGQVQSAVETM